MKVNPARDYGSRPDYLPEFMQDSEVSEACQIVMLSYEESHVLEEASLNRFVAFRSSELHWEEGSYTIRRLCDDGNDLALVLREMLAPCVEEYDHVAIFWPNLLLPTVTLPVRVFIDRVAEIWDTDPQFWLYPVGGPILIECLVDGQVTVATIPST
ncbi:hypothetical protein [Stackebrandtia soli]|uniref:hypothetical protein n=1 Tax=Stackebrandtia soli TaxID=1892856 RepID=UPI0039EA2305